MSEKELNLTHVLFEFKRGQINMKQCLKEIEQIYQHEESQKIDELGEHYGEN